jgi:hypothetical protein
LSPPVFAAIGLSGIVVVYSLSGVTSKYII